MTRRIRPDQFTRAVALIVIWLLVASSFIVGVRRGMDHMVAWGPWDDFWHLSVAISDDAYGLHHGYVGFKKVFDSLETSVGSAGGAVAASSPKLIPVLSNGPLLDAALQKAASFEDLHDVGLMFPPTLETFQTLHLMAPVAEDLGESKFYATAFRVFGLRLESAYYLYFLLLAVSLAAFMLQFYKSPAAIVALLFSALSFHLFFFISFFSPFVPTVYVNRFASTLCIVPALHFVFLLLEKRRPDRLSIGLAAAQLLILLFGTFIRSSANWTVLAILLILVMQLFWSVWRGAGRRGLRGLGWASKQVRVWPVLLLLLGVVSLGYYRDAVPHPIFRSWDNTPYHMRWHSAWLGLLVHPHWQEVFPPTSPSGDDFAFSLTRNHLHEAGLDDQFISKYTNNVVVRLHEAYMREQFLKFVAAHPSYMLQLEINYKPNALIELLRTVFDYRTINQKVLIPVLVTFFAAVALVWNRRRDAFGDIWHVPAAAGVLFGCSLLPILWAYPAIQVIADEVWTTSMFAAAVAWTLIVVALRVATRAAGKDAVAASENVRTQIT